MNETGPRPIATSTVQRTVPSRDGLWLILSGTVYLVVICALQLTVAIDALAHGPRFLPENAMDVRDVVALFGWVGFMITGVSVIIIPNHLRVRVKPAYLPRLHLLLANFGLVGFFVSALAYPTSISSYVFLLVVSASFTVFGAGVIRTVYPFLLPRRAVNDPTTTPHAGGEVVG